jgi:hypothetical protein
MRRRLLLAAALACAAPCGALAGCGTGTADLLAIRVTGGFAGVDDNIRVTDDGRASCNRRPLAQLPSQTVLDAREVKRNLRPLARRGASFPAAAGADLRHYELRSFDGVVRWDEGQPLPPRLGRATLLALRLERSLCRGG